MLEPGVAVVERDAAVERLMDLNFRSSEAEAARLRVNLQPAAVPLHDVVVADDAFVGEAADAFEIAGAGRQAFSAWRGVRAKRRL